MLEMLRNLSDTGKLFIVVFCLSLLSLLISLWTGGLAATITVSGAIIAILTTTKGIWESEYDSKTNIRLASLGIIYLLAISQPSWKAYINPTMLEPIVELVPFSQDVINHIPSDTPSLAALLIAVAGIYSINYFIRDNTAMKEHPVPIEIEFPEKPYKKRFESFCRVLSEDINRLDRESNWSVEYFTPLDAEVEVRSGNKRYKKVTDLLTAIRSDQKSEVFLVLGDPGSGKSVALRKLCRDLLEEAKRTGKIPLYINLREWKPKQEWTEEHPPQVEELYDFVVSNLKSRGDVYISEFINEYFYHMSEDGRFFFILDSFDEIPAVLDVNENSWLIDRLSDIIYRFLAGANASRGVLASRVFRRPTSNFNTRVTLEIRPFTEQKIIENFEKSTFYSQNLKEHLFKERINLIPVARNPFTAALIYNYAQEHENKLPSNQAELYSSYVNKRLDACRERLEEKLITKDRVIKCATDIADVMLTTQVAGLEASISSLKEQLVESDYTHDEIEKIIDILKFSKLGRVGSGDDKRFSFVHRRFNEYFVVQRLIEYPDRVPQDAIPADSRWRDALILYCEVADEAEARRIANFCWGEIEQVIKGNVDVSEPQFLRMLHCLRFLKEGFRSRLECIEDFRDELADFIKNTIENQTNLLFRKFAVETIGLLKNEDIDSIVIQALSINNTWINETSINSCRHLPEISRSLKRRVMCYIDNFDLLYFYKMKRELLFSFSLSNEFHQIASYIRWRIVDFYLLSISIILAIIISPSELFVVTTVYLLMQLTVKLLELIESQEPTLSVKKNHHKKSEARKQSNKFFMSSKIFFSRLKVLFSPLSTLALVAFFVFKNKRRKYTFLFVLVFFLDIFFLRTEHIVEVIILVFASALVIPFYQIIFQLIPMLKQAKLNIGFWRRTIIFILSLLLAVVFVYLYIRFSYLIVGIIIDSRFMPSLTPILSSMMIGFLIVLCGIGVFPLILDCLTLNRMKLLSINSISRLKIASDLKAYKSSQGRLGYVENLQNKKIRPTGVWPNGELPNFSNDEASTLLAKLEEKWLGLDR